MTLGAGESPAACEVIKVQFDKLDLILSNLPASPASSKQLVGT